MHIRILFVWVDATFLITAPLDESIFESRFFSGKNNVHSNALVCKYRWAVNFVYASKNSDIMKHIRNLFCAFWEQNKRSINYLLIDYCFEYEAINNRIFTQLLEDMPFTNEHSHDIRIHFNDAFDPQKWSEWLSNTNLFKLTYKGKLKSKTSDGQITNYGYLLHNF